MGDPIPPLITPLSEDEWPLLKHLRLAALEDAPDSFSPTLASAAAHEDAYWQAATKGLATSADAELLIARPERGLVSAVRDDKGIGHIGAMWVHPGSRAAGIGAALLDAAIAFLGAGGCSTIELSVTETNDRAIALYESRRFLLTGDWEPLRDESPLKNLFMRRTGDR